MFLFFCFALSAPYELAYFDQTLDHFDPSMADVLFPQRLFIDHRFARIRFENLVLYFGDIGSVGTSAPFPHCALELAREFGASLLRIEPRYFGDSVPFSVLSAANLSYNTVEQAIEDAADIVGHIQRRFGCRRVIALGRGLGGSIASWLRLRHPRRVDAVWSARGFVRTAAYSDSVDLRLYRKLQSIDSACQSATESLLRRIEATMTHGDNESQQQMRALFGFAESADGDSVLFEVAEAFLLMAATQTEGAAKLLSGHCARQRAAPSIEQFAAVFKDALSAFRLTTHSFDPRAGVAEGSSFRDQRALLYLKCNQLGNFHVYNRDYYFRARTIGSEYFDGLCKEAFGIEKVANSSAINTRYGDIENGASSIFFTYSNKDIEYEMVNVSSNRGMNVVASEMQQESYADELSYSENDEFIMVQERASELIKLWTDFSKKDVCRKHGIVVLNKCKCDDGYSGEYCQNRTVSAKIYKLFVSLTSFIPTFLFVFFIILGWVKLIVFTKSNRPIVF